MSCTPSNIIRSAKGIEYIVHPNGDTRDIIRAIMDADAKADQYIDRNAVQCLKGRTNEETLYNVWRFVKSNVKYKTDQPGFEKVKSPGALFHHYGKGDCKSFSIAEAAILRALGFSNIRFRFAAYGKKNDFTHVYIVVKSGNKDYILDATYTSFDREVTYSRKLDMVAKGRTSAVQGAPKVGGDMSDIIGLFSFGAILFAAYTLLK